MSSECDICSQEYTGSGKQSMLVLVPCGHSCCSECYHEQHRNKVYTTLNNTKKDKNICHKCGLNITSKLVSPSTNVLAGERATYKKQLNKIEKERIRLYAENERLKDRITKLEEEIAERDKNGEERPQVKKEKEKVIEVEDESKLEAQRALEKKNMKSKASKERKERERYEEQVRLEEEKRLEEEEIARQEFLQLDKQLFQVGDVAKIINLVNQDSLNGGLGEIMGFVEEKDPQTGIVVGVRFTVQLMGNKRQIGVRPVNLVLVSRTVPDPQSQPDGNEENNENDENDAQNYVYEEPVEEAKGWPVCSACTYENLDPECIAARECEMCGTEHPL